MAKKNPYEIAVSSEKLAAFEANQQTILEIPFDYERNKNVYHVGCDVTLTDGSRTLTRRVKFVYQFKKEGEPKVLMDIDGRK